MKKTPIIIGTILIVIILTTPFMFANIFRDKNKIVGLQDDNVYFKMKPSEIETNKGIPVEKEYSDVSPEIFYFYDEYLYGRRCRTAYMFYKTFFDHQLYRVDAQIPIFDLSDGEQIFDQIADDIIKHYEKRTGYFNEGIKEEESLKTLQFGINRGALGDSITIEWDVGEQEIFVVIETIW